MKSMLWWITLCVEQRIYVHVNYLHLFHFNWTKISLFLICVRVACISPYLCYSICRFIYFHKSTSTDIKLYFTYIIQYKKVLPGSWTHSLFSLWKMFLVYPLEFILFYDLSLMSNVSNNYNIYNPVSRNERKFADSLLMNRANWIHEKI